MKSNIKSLLTIMSILILGGSSSWAADNSKKPVADGKNLSATASPSVGLQTESTPGTVTATMPEKKENKPVSLYYSLYFSGPSFTHLDGKSGPGASLGMQHYLGGSMKLSSNWKLSLTTLTTNTLSSDSVWDTFAFQNPYLTLSRSNLLNQEDHGMGFSANLRYYVPTSSGTYDSIGTSSDSGNGTLRFSVVPSRTFFKDDSLSVRLENRWTVPLAVSNLETGERLGSKVTEQRDLTYTLIASAGYDMTDNFQPYLVYLSNTSHYQSKQGAGRGTSWEDNQILELGFDYQPAVKGLNLGMYVDFPTAEKTFTEAQIGLYLDYTML